MKVVGRAIPRLDGVDKATGRTRFVADYHFPGELVARVVRSPYASARIKAVNTQKAALVKDVLAVVTGQNTNCLIGDCVQDQPPIARDKVRFFGEPVAVIVAETIEAAQLAAEKVQVDYEPLPPVIDPLESFEPTAPLIHEHLNTYRILPSFHFKAGTNVCHHFKIRKGDPETAFQQSAQSFEGEYIFPHIAHAALEPHGAIACWEHDNSLWVVSATQSPHFVRHCLADVFHIPESTINVIAPPIGGGFGGKSDYTIEPLVALAAKAVPGRPVKLIFDRQEVFTGTVLGRGCRAFIRSAVSPEGVLQAVAIKLYFAVGAYANNAINVVDGGGHNALGPYFVPNITVDSYALYTNTPPVGAYRGYSHPEVHWMLERHMDMISCKLGINPTLLRERNLIKPGQENAFGQVITEHDGNPFKVMQKVIESLERAKAGLPEKKGVLRGTGIAVFVKSPVMATDAASCATVRVHRDGSVDINMSASEMGQGSVTALSQIAAETLELPLGVVRINREVQTQTCPFEWQSVASSTTWKVGSAIMAACREIIRIAKNNVALLHDVPVDRVRYSEGTLIVDQNEATRIPIGKVALACVFPDGHALGQPLTATGYYLPKGLTYADPDTGRGRLAAEWTFGCQGALLEVNPATGKVTIIKMVTALDVGTVINPLSAEQQVVGAMVQGMGPTLFEQILYDDQGRMRNPSFTDYKIPGLEDIPEQMEVIFLDTPTNADPYNARPLAEHGVVGVAPAIANAIRQATGLHFSQLPITPDKIVAALRESEVNR